jgi:exopolyphosphatase/guanosine-5'-triphosphate,3'-diphosphate pyrophosphatase
MPARLAVVAEGVTRRDCVAVVDVGSNSLRLVIYDGLKRTGRTLFNEKVMCGLGRGLSKTGRLDPDGVEQAKANIQRFITLARNVGAAHFDILATAAVRDATDGPAFVADIEKRFSTRVRVLSGEEEGKLSAMGVLAAIPEAAGVGGGRGGGTILE